MIGKYFLCFFSWCSFCSYLVVLAFLLPGSKWIFSVLPPLYFLTRSLLLEFVLKSEVYLTGCALSLIELMVHTCSLRHSRCTWLSPRAIAIAVMRSLNAWLIPICLVEGCRVLVSPFFIFLLLLRRPVCVCYVSSSQCQCRNLLCGYGTITQFPW